MSYCQISCPTFITTVSRNMLIALMSLSELRPRKSMDRTVSKIGSRIIALYFVTIAFRNSGSFIFSLGFNFYTILRPASLNLSIFINFSDIQRMAIFSNAYYFFRSVLLPFSCSHSLIFLNLWSYFMINVTPHSSRFIEGPVSFS